MVDKSNETDERTVAVHSESGNIRPVTLVLAVLLLGAGLRLFLFASGRTPIDGDESIMGMMGADLRGFRRIPLYFYGQSYLGALEIPFLALTQFIGATKTWAYSVWPLRLTAAAFLILLGLVHFRLCRRFFGIGVALASCFFLAVGPFHWAEYSSRLRHVVLMLMLGEVLVLLTLQIQDDWREHRRGRARTLFFLGLLAGLGWWHYQLIALFFLIVFALLALRSTYLVDLFRGPLSRPGATPSLQLTWQWGSLVRVLVLLMPVAVFVGMTMGKGWSYWPYFGRIIPVLCVGAFLSHVPYWQSFQRQRAAFVERADPALSPWSALHHASPAVVTMGFWAGSLPTLVYMATLSSEFWVHPTEIDLFSFFSRVQSTLWTEIGPMLDILRLDTYDPESREYGSPATVRTYFYLLVYGIGGYAAFRRFNDAEQPEARRGLVIFGGMALLILMFRAALPRNLSSFSPRFVMPMVLPASVLFGMAFQELLASISPGNGGGALRKAVALLLGGLCLGVFLLSWREAPSTPLDLRTGHRKYALEVVDELRDRSVRRAYLEYQPRDDQLGWIPLGWELMYASRNEIRFHYATFEDRLFGLIDEEAYGWEEYYLFRPDTSADLEEFEFDPQSKVSIGFTAADFRVIPLPQNYAPYRGWLPWSPRGDQATGDPESLPNSGS